MLSALILGAMLAPAPKPNVVIFLVDDLGWQDTSLSFGVGEKVVGRHFRTPNVAALAKRGVQVNQAYSSCTVCTPTRASLLTGTNPARNHITSWVHSGGDTDSGYPGMKMTDWEKGGLRPGYSKTMAEVFRTAGYETVQVGKAHFGAAGFAGANPTNLGFNRTIGGSAAGHPSSHYGVDNFAAKNRKPDAPPAHNDVPDLEAYHGKDIYLDEALALEAAKVIDQADKESKPLFLWFAPYSVHTPIQANNRYLTHYEGMDVREAAYATMVETYDAALGTLVKAFQEAGELENTLFVFTSDNGGLSQSARGGYPNLHNLPLRSGKGSSYEGGTRVPLVVAGPGVKNGATLAATWLNSADLFANVTELAGVPMAAPDSVSFATAFRNGQDQKRGRPLVWHYPHHRGWAGPGLEPHSSIRSGDFKAIFYYGTRQWELYNLSADLGETRDLSNTRKDKLKEMADLLLAELKSMGALFPADEKSGELILPLLAEI